MRSSTPTCFVLVTVFTSCAAAPAGAQGNWQHEVALYGWFTAIEGDSEFGERENQVDVEISDVLDSLETTLMARYRTHNDRWSVVLDSIFAGFGGSGEVSRAIDYEVDFDLDEFVIQGDFGWRFSERAELFGGIRYFRIETELEIRSLIGTSTRRADVSLWDPVVGLRTIAPFADHWLFQAQADVGGGANADFTWQAMAHVGWRPGDAFGFWLGYRAIAIEFDDGGNLNRLSMDSVSHGPSLGVSYAF